MNSHEIRTVLVTGANGFIGSRLCRLLEASDYLVRILCRETSDLSQLKDISVDKRHGDITRPDTLPQAVMGVDYVIHLAGMVKANKREDFYRVNETGTTNLLNAIKNHNPDIKKFVQVSSVAAAGPARERPRRESDPPNPITTYGHSKLCGEEAMAPFTDLIPITTIRPPAVYGPGDKATLPLFQMTRKGFKPYLGGGRNKVQMVYVDDLVAAIKLAMESDAATGEAFFIADERAWSIREMLDMMGRLQGKNGGGISIPKFMLRGIALINEGAAKITRKLPLFSFEKVRELTEDWALDVSKARDVLGFTTRTDFETGARHTIEWYLREGWLK